MRPSGVVLRPKKTHSAMFAAHILQHVSVDVRAMGDMRSGLPSEPRGPVVKYMTGKNRCAKCCIGNEIDASQDDEAEGGSTQPFPEHRPFQRSITPSVHSPPQTWGSYHEPK